MKFLISKVMFVALILMVLSLPILGQESTEDDQTMVEVTEVPQYDTQGYIRFTHLMVDGPTVTISVDDEEIGSGIKFLQFTDWMPIPTGSHSITITEGDENLFAQTIEVAHDIWLTVGVIPTEDGPSLTLIQQNVYTELPTTAQVTFANALSSGESVNFTRDGAIFVANLPVTVGNSVVQNTIPVDASIFNYNISIDADPMLEDVEIATVDTSAYLLIATGSSDDPQLVVEETEKWEINLLDGSLDAPATVLEVLHAEPLADAFLAAVEGTEIEDLLTGNDPITVFVPANYVFDDVDLTGDDLIALLRRHIVIGNYKAGDLFMQNPTLETVDGDTLTISETEQGFVNGAQIIEVNKVGINGTVHIINSVLTTDS